MKKDAESGQFWEHIGSSIISLLGEEDGIFLYIECERAFYGGQIYIEREKDVEQGDISFRAFQPILDQWEKLDPKARWGAVRYYIDNGRFKVQFDYFDRVLEDIEGIDQLDDRMKRAFTERFGNKPMRLVGEGSSE